MKKRIVSFTIASALALGTFGGAFADDLELKSSKIYIDGYEDGTFMPQSIVKRAEIAKMIAEIRDLDEKDESFEDVPDDHWASGFIGAVQESGLMEGDDMGEFNPEAGLTRAELAAIVSRMIGESGGEDKELSDIEDHWARDHIRKAVRAGIVEGYPDGTYRPQQQVTRAETVKMLNGVMGILEVDERIDERVENPFSDIEEHWAKDHVLAASTDYEYILEAGKMTLYENMKPVLKSAELFLNDENSAKIEVKFSKVMESITIDELYDIPDFKIYIDGVETPVLFESPEGFDPDDESTFVYETDTFIFTIRPLTPAEVEESEITIMAVEDNDVTDIYGNELKMNEPVVVLK